MQTRHVLLALAGVFMMGVAAAAAPVRASDDEILRGLRKQWLRGRRADADTVVEWRVDLVQPAEGLQWLDDTFWAVSDPDHPDYGNHVSVQDIARHLAPSADVVRAVVAWASAGGAGEARVSVTGDYVFAATPAAVLEELFGVDMHVFRHTRTSSQLVRAATHLPVVPASVPEGLKAAISAVVGVADFPVDARRIGASTEAPETTGVKVTPPVIWSAYGLESAPKSFTTAEASQSVAEFEQAYFYPSDLNSFQKMFDLEVRNLTRIVGPNNPQSGYLGECSLDVEYIAVTGRGISTWMFSQSQFDMTTWAQTVMSTTGAPLVHSVSWGSGESGFPAAQMQRANVEFQKMGAIGMTVLTASGDTGTGSTGFFSCGVFSPTFPASSPYVTAVGGTTIAATGQPESGWKDSGGGFSTVFARPSYQESVVSKYLSSATLPAQKYWNSTGRGIPDVSALATNFQVLITNFLGPLSGTSAATPTWAGTLSVINGLRNQAGLKPLGFANPALYKLASVGTDIVAGNNKVTSCPAGFPAVAGWDAITGLGTPMYDTLKAGLASSSA